MNDPSFLGLSLVFHAGMASLVAAALVVLARRPGLARLVAGFVASLVLSGVLATALGHHLLKDAFAFFRFLSYGVAVYLPILLGGGTWILVRFGQGKAAILPALLALVIAGAAVDAFLIEPKWLEISRHTISSAKLEKPLRIVVLADYQSDQFGDYERRVWKAANSLETDLLLLPGDYLQQYRRGEYLELLEKTRTYLREIQFGAKARLGAFAVGGDVEYRRPDWGELFDGTSVTTLTETQTLEFAELTLTGLTLRDTRNRELTVTSSPRFHVAFGHAPDYALRDFNIDLQIAGHTHGGQLRIPGLGPLMTFSRVPRAWAAGVTDLGRGRTLVVSRGAGMERGRAPRMRFLCRPEIVILDVQPLHDSRRTIATPPIRRGDSAGAPYG